MYVYQRELKLQRIIFLGLKQGQTVHKLQITTLGNIYIYIPLAPLYTYIYIQSISYITVNIYCISRNLPNIDVHNYSLDLR